MIPIVATDFGKKQWFTSAFSTKIHDCVFSAISSLQHVNKMVLLNKHGDDEVYFISRARNEQRKLSLFSMKLSN